MFVNTIIIYIYIFLYEIQVIQQFILINSKIKHILKLNGQNLKNTYNTYFIQLYNNNNTR